MKRIFFLAVLLALARGVFQSSHDPEVVLEKVPSLGGAAAEWPRTLIVSPEEWTEFQARGVTEAMLANYVPRDDMHEVSKRALKQKSWTAQAEGAPNAPVTLWRDARGGAVA
jgi:hypothetical protein